MSDHSADLEMGYTDEDISDENEEVDSELQPKPPSKLFTDEDGTPIKFFLHKSVKKEETKQKLRDDIEAHGGHVVEDVFQADTILVHRKFGEKDRSTLQRSYATNSNPMFHKIFVEFTPFVQQCIMRNGYRHSKPQVHGMNGIRPGTHRVGFTQEDDDELINYIAKSIPDPEAGGRQSINFYKQLVEMGRVNPEHCGWATRHTPESWKQRYKTHKKEFDLNIQAIVENDPPSTQYQLWTKDRRRNGRVNQLYDEDEEMEEEYNSEEHTHDEEEREYEDDEQRYEKEDIVERVEGSGARHIALATVPTTRQSSRIQKSSQLAAEALSVQPQNKNQRNRHRNLPGTKGKEKIIHQEQDETHDYESVDGLFGDNPGPSRQTPGPNFVRQARHGNIFSTQDTLVSAPDPIDIDKVGNKDVPSHTNNPAFPDMSPWPSPIQPRRSSQPSPMPPTGPQAFSSPPRNRSQHPTNRVKTIPEGAPSATEPSNSKRQIPRMAARRPRAFVRQNTDLQLKNQSVESTEVQQTATRKRKQTPGSDIIEISDTEGVAVSESQRIRNSLGKGKARNNSPIARKPEPNYPNEQNLRSSMDTDDLQTKRDLRANRSQSLHSASRFSNDFDLLEPPSQFLGYWEDSPDTDPRNNEPSKSQRITPGHDYQTPHRVPFTPTFSLARGRSTSSESFPFEGTKASAYKKDQTQKAKHTPYQPPEGTRASQLTN